MAISRVYPVKSRFGCKPVRFFNIEILACEQALLFGRVKRDSQERVSKGPAKGELATIPYKFSFVPQMKGNTIGSKMTFRKSKLIDNRLSWHPLRLCVKFGSQGDQIGTENLFQLSKQTGSFVVILKENIVSRG